MQCRRQGIRAREGAYPEVLMTALAGRSTECSFFNVTDGANSSVRHIDLHVHARQQ